MSKAPAVATREVLGYMDESVARYVKDIEGASNIPELKEAVARWPVLAADAIEQAEKLTGDDWGDWLTGKARERRGSFAGEDWARKFGAILMPGPMMEVSMIASLYKVPFGCAYIRKWQAEQK